jgi:hypothetical protein
MAFLLDMKRLRTIEKDFILKPNPYVSDEQSSSIIWKLAVGELLGLSAFACFALTLLRIRPTLTSAPSFRNFTYFQGLSSVAAFFYHIHELQQLGNTIPPAELNDKMNTYDLRYK